MDSTKSYVSRELLLKHCFNQYFYINDGSREYLCVRYVAYFDELKEPVLVCLVLLVHSDSWFKKIDCNILRTKHTSTKLHRYEEQPAGEHKGAFSS